MTNLNMCDRLIPLFRAVLPNSQIFPTRTFSKELTEIYVSRTKNFESFGFISWQKWTNLCIKCFLKNRLRAFLKKYFGNFINIFEKFFCYKGNYIQFLKSTVYCLGISEKKILNFLNPGFNYVFKSPSSSQWI